MGKPADKLDRRQAAERDLLKNDPTEQKATEILESMSDAFVALDREWRYTYVNGAAERIVGLRREEMLGRTVWELFPQEGTQFERALRRAMDEGVTVHFEEYYPPLDTWFEDTIYPSADGVTVYARDITGRKRAEEALRASEERLRLLIESTKDYVIFTLDSKGLVSSWNPGAERAFGYHEAEIIGHAGEILFTPEDRERGVPAEEMRRAREEGRASDDRYHLRKDGTRFFASGVMTFLRDQGAEGYAKISRDRTERRQAEEALRRAHEELEQRVIERTRQLSAINAELIKVITERERAEERLQEYEKAVEGLEEMIVVVDRDYRYMLANRAFLNYSGLQREQLVGHLVPELLYKRVFEQVTKKKLDECLQGKVVKYELRYNHPELGERDLLISYFPIAGPGGVDRVVGVLQDITERKLAEVKVAESQRRFRLLVESIPHHVWNFRPDGSMGYWNQRLVDYTGLTAEELQQGGWAALHPDDVERVKAAWQEAWAHGAQYEMEQRVRGRDGRYRRFLCRAVPVHGERGQPVEWFGTNTDIEDRRQAEEALQEAQAELTHAARVMTMGELTASIAHEINQPLGAIVTNGQACLRLLAREAPDLHKLREVVQRIIDDGMRASEVIKRIRALLKKAAPERELLNINESIREVISQVASALLKNQILLRTELDDDLPLVLCDRIQLQQVMLNLLLNGIEAMNGEGWQPRELSISSRQSKHDEVMVAVRDTGHGLEPQGLERIFDAFVTSKEGGLGLGLSISRTIIDAQGGRLWATPNESSGATFLFTLPTG